MAGAAKGISALNKGIDRVMRDDKLTPVQKREQIDKLLSRRNQVAKEGVQEYRELKKAANDR